VEAPKVGRFDRPVILAITGVLVFPIILVIEGAGESAGLPPAVVFVGVALVAVAALRKFVSVISRAQNERRFLAYALGLLLPLFPFGVLSQFPVEVVLLVDVALALFFVRLFRAYPERRGVEAGPGLETSSETRLQTTKS
jgi:hypothetical protein